MPLLLADASPIIGFVAASHHNILWSVVQPTYGRIEVAHQVDVEVSRVAPKKSRKALTNYEWMKRQGQVHVLPEATIFGPDNDVFNAAAGLIDASPRGSSSPASPCSQFDKRTKDLGEAFTVGHARKYRKAGTQAEILIDDGGGIRWADGFKIPHVGTLWVLEQAIAQGAIADRAHLTDVYTMIARHAHLPLLSQTNLQGLLP